MFFKKWSNDLNHTDTSELKMKKLKEIELSKYLTKIETKTLLAYGVYQIEASGLELLSMLKETKIRLWVYLSKK